MGSEPSPNPEPRHQARAAMQTIKAADVQASPPEIGSPKASTPALHYLRNLVQLRMGQGTIIPLHIMGSSARAQTKALRGHAVDVGSVRLSNRREILESRSLNSRSMVQVEGLGVPNLEGPIN